MLGYAYNNTRDAISRVTGACDLPGAEPDQERLASRSSARKDSAGLVEGARGEQAGQGLWGCAPRVVARRLLVRRATPLGA